MEARELSRRTLEPRYALRRSVLFIALPLAVSLLLILKVHSMLDTDLGAALPILPVAAHFQFEQQAQRHCPEDSVVWASARLGTYDTDGERWYGQTSDGAFICLQDAEGAGYRASHAAR
jgi:hypothetical protein